MILTRHPIKRRSMSLVPSGTSCPAQEKRFLYKPSVSDLKVSSRSKAISSGTSSHPACVDISAHCLDSVSPRKDYILFSTRTPSAIQRIPWPAVDDEDLDIASATRKRRRSWTGYDTWMTNEHQFPWLIDANGERYFE
jgi:hypothetical protein